MSPKQERRSRSRAAVGKLALIVLAILTATSSAPASEQEIIQEVSQTYQHTYDEVFQASQKTIERKGMFVTASDKDKGIISGASIDKTNSFNIHIEALNAKPETRVTFQCKWSVKKLAKDGEKNQRSWIDGFLSDLQKVLSTYD